ncbi:hypothetical protein BCEN4_110059 [Burkholderia cenocepacia]|nr:hypothetical protein BCEN4_110059 [Burkholderia cenocepacia]
MPQLKISNYFFIHTQISYRYPIKYGCGMAIFRSAIFSPPRLTKHIPFVNFITNHDLPPLYKQRHGVMQ